MQKYQERKAALEKSKDGQEKEKWKSVLIMDITSSDESGYEGDKEVIPFHGCRQMLHNLNKNLMKSV